MIPREKGSRSRNNVTNLADVRQARALAESAVDEQGTSMANEPGEALVDDRHGLSLQANIKLMQVV